MMAIGFALLVLGGLLYGLTSKWYMLDEPVSTWYWRVRWFVSPFLAVFGAALCVASAITWLWRVMP